MGEKNLETKAMRAARERREMQRYPKVNLITTSLDQGIS